MIYFPWTSTRSTATLWCPMVGVRAPGISALAVVVRDVLCYCMGRPDVATSPGSWAFSQLSFDLSLPSSWPSRSFDYKPPNRCKRFVLWSSPPAGIVLTTICPRYVQPLAADAHVQFLSSLQTLPGFEYMESGIARLTSCCSCSCACCCSIVVAMVLSVIARAIWCSRSLSPNCCSPLLVCLIASCVCVDF